ncbi:hypothetical protein CEXT_199181 [Caerostris extrusa]|uniref:Uncharacterized protein n=1 Tax=Caerostris extrusa TaxID=172846 RepID=A0AAV4WT11_CAEEX|nr:hypothetical protein CEXT_199181 [Caerostris extrusa]
MVSCSRWGGGKESDYSALPGGVGQVLRGRCSWNGNSSDEKKSTRRHKRKVHGSFGLTNDRFQMPRTLMRRPGRPLRVPLSPAGDRGATVAQKKGADTEGIGRGGQRHVPNKQPEDSFLMRLQAFFYGPSTLTLRPFS